MNRRLVTMYTVLMLATMLYASPISAQNLIQDGSFEDPVVQPPQLYDEYFVGPLDNSPWTVVGMPGANVLIVISYCDLPSGVCYHAEDLNQWLDLTGAQDNNDTTGVEQTVPTIPAHIYQLSYWVGTVTTPTSGTQSAVNVSINGVHSTPCSGVNAMQDTHNLVWKQITCTFTAAGPTTLTFFNGDGPRDNINGLDNVQVIDLQTGYIEICKHRIPLIRSRGCSTSQRRHPPSTAVRLGFRLDSAQDLSRCPLAGLPLPKHRCWESRCQMSPPSHMTNRDSTIMNWIHGPCRTCRLSLMSWQAMRMRKPLRPSRTMQHRRVC